MGRMSPEALDAFLGRVGYCKLACLDDAGHPYIVPVMSVYHDGGFYLCARERSAWRTMLQRDGRVCLNLEDGEQRAQVQGQAEYLAGPILGVPPNVPYIQERAEQEGWGDSAYTRNLLTYEPM